MGISIHDIAKAAGVSTTTVSRVINGSSKLRPETKEKVKRVMAELDYSPNLLARGLSNSKIFNIALLIDVNRGEYFNPFFYEVMHGIEMAVMAEGYCLIIAGTTSENNVDILKKMINERRIAGVLIPSSLADSRTITSLTEKNFPFVVLGETEDISAPCSWVDVNNRQGGMIAVTHLFEQGYKEIAFISDEMEHLFNRHRLEGYRQALEKHGRTYEPKKVLSCDGSKEAAYQKIKRLFAEEGTIDGVVCGDNVISFGVLKAIQEKGLRIPEDVGIVTFDSYPLAELLEPRLTSINIDVLQLGALAADTLMNVIDNPKAPARQSLISTSLEYRESSSGKKSE